MWPPAKPVGRGEADLAPIKHLKFPLPCLRTPALAGGGGLAPVKHLKPPLPCLVLTCIGWGLGEPVWGLVAACPLGKPEVARPPVVARLAAPCMAARAWRLARLVNMLYCCCCCSTPGPILQGRTPQLWGGLCRASRSAPQTTARTPSCRQGTTNEGERPGDNTCTATRCWQGPTAVEAHGHACHTLDQGAPEGSTATKQASQQHYTLLCTKQASQQHNTLL